MADESLPIDILDQSGRLIGAAQNALEAQDVSRLASAGQAIISFLKLYRAPMLANADTAGDVDQLDAAQSQLSDRWLALGGAAGTPGPNAVTSVLDAGVRVGTSPTGAFTKSLADSAQETVDQVADGFSKLLGKTGEAAKQSAGTIKVILYILASAIGLALVAFAFVYAGGMH